VSYRKGEVTVVTPTIPPRHQELARARASVAAQKRPPDHHAIMMDFHHNGAGPTRNAALAQVETEWVAFLDDDDEFLAHHLRSCEKAAFWTGADVIYPIGAYDFGVDPLRQCGTSFSAHRLRAGNFIPITTLCRTERVMAVGGFPTGAAVPRMGEQPCEDWGLWLLMLADGAAFAPLHQVTWRCHQTTGRYGSYAGRVWSR
jgi:hypothetical protein